MNLKATLTPIGNLRAVQSVAGKGGGSGSVSWNAVKDKPFDTISHDDFVVESGELQLKGGSSASVQSDWAQNITTADDYVKNRTHWHESGTEAVIGNVLTPIDPTIDWGTGEGSLKRFPEQPSAFEYYYSTGHQESLPWHTPLYMVVEAVDVNDNSLTFTGTAELDWNDVNKGRIYGIRLESESGPLECEAFWLFQNPALQILTVHDYGCPELKEITSVKIEGEGGSTVETIGTKTIDTYHKLDNNYISIDNSTIKVDDYSDTLYVDGSSISGVSVDWYNVYNQPNFAEVAYSGSYNDLYDKPTIPEPTAVSATSTLAVGTTIGSITVDGLTTTFYAPSGGGGSVSIDNKSLVEVNGVIQEAVPVYSASELIPAEIAGPGLYLTSFTYPARIDLDAYFYAPNGFSLITNQSEPAYRICVKLTDDTILDGTWEATSSGGYEYGGWGNWVVDDSGYELYIANEGDGNYRLHIYMNGSYINDGNVSSMVIYQTEEVSGYDDLETICSANNLAYSSVEISPAHTEMVYHKLPIEYQEQQIQTYGNDYTNYNGYNTMAYEDRDGRVRIAGIGVSGNILTFAQSNGRDDCRTYIELYENKLPIPKTGGFIDFADNYHWNVNSADLVGNITTFHMDQSDIDYIAQDLGAGEFPIVSYYSYLPYQDSKLRIFGYIHIVSATDISITGWESVLDSAVYNTDHWDLIWKPGISPRGDIYISAPQRNGKQNINAFFLPIDNQTIKTNSDGNIETAIPPCPTTTDGTYTLQATVQNGVITYSWI